MTKNKRHNFIFVLLIALLAAVLFSCAFAADTLAKFAKSNDEHAVNLSLDARYNVSFIASDGFITSPAAADLTWSEASSIKATKICRLGEPYGELPKALGPTSLALDGWSADGGASLLSPEDLMNISGDHSFSAVWKPLYYNVCFVDDYPDDVPGVEPIDSVKYIENPAGAYIDTGVLLNENSKVIMDFSFTDISNNFNFIFGSRNKAGVNEFEVTCTANGSGPKVIRDDYYTDDRIFSTFVPQVDQMLHIEKDKNTLTINGEVLAVHDVHEFDTSPYTCTFFATNYANMVSTEFAKGRLYSAEIWDEKDLVRKFEPYYNPTTGAFGLYDSVENKCYYSETQPLTGERYIGLTMNVGYYDEIFLPERGAKTPSYTKILGWSTEPDGKGTVYAAGTTVSALTNIDSETIHFYPIYEETELKVGGYRVSYVESNGQSAIDTGIALNDSSRVYAEFAFSDFSRQYNFIFGARSSAGYDEFELCYTATGAPGEVKVLRDDYNDNARIFTDFAPTSGQKFTIDKTANKLYIDGELKADHSSFVPGKDTFDSGYTCTIFDTHYGNLNYGEAAAGRIYAFKIWQGDELVRDFIPIFNTDENEAGLYDMVSDTFFKSVSGVPLIAGPK